MRFHILVSGQRRCCVGMMVAAGLVWWSGGDWAGGDWARGTAWARSGKRPVARPSPIPQRPKLPSHKDRACRRDKDCVFRPTVCRVCAPCKPTWRSVCNRKTARMIRAIRWRSRCALPKCHKCSSSSNWLGRKVVCFQKQCVIAPLQKKSMFGLRGLKCKRHSDCGFLPMPYCVCLPCGLYWRQAANRRTVLREKSSTYVMGQCIRMRCKKCSRRALGSKALCIRNRCTVR